MQFAGQRTNLELKPIGDPVNLLVKLTDDTLPSPGAIMVTKITPQSTQQDGLTEKELCDYLMNEIFTPQTCVVGYNSVRFDDEFVRHLFWRNFYDPYEWQWKDGRSRWDLLDVVRLTRALRPEGIKWPTQKVRKRGTDKGETVEVATNRLELITKLNGIVHTHAHDAMSDVEALIDVTRLIKEKQPQLYDYLYGMRAKKAVQRLVNLERPKPFVYASGRYATKHDKTTVAFPLAPGRNGNVLVFDLRYNLEDLLKETGTGTQAEEKKKVSMRDEVDGTSTNVGTSQSFFPTVKELAYNKCPAVAPLGVLEQGDGWKKIGLTPELVQHNLKTLLAHPEFAEQMRTMIEEKPEWPPAVDAESALYDGFLDEPDRMRCTKIRSTDAEELADLHPDFTDERLVDLFLHYKAKNSPSSLSEDEHEQWEKYRKERLARQVPKFMKELEIIEQGSKKPTDEERFILEELKLWCQSLWP